MLLPLIFFGVDGTIRLYTDWRVQVAKIADLTFHASLWANRETGPPIVTLHKALVNLTGKTETMRLGTLFPRAFDASFL